MDGRPLVGRAAVVSTPAAEASRMIVSEAVPGRIGLLFDPLTWSPMSIAVYDAGLANLELSEAAPLALNSYESVQAGQPAGPYRAGLIEDVEGRPEKARVSTGTVTWRVSSEKLSSGAPAAITADVEVPKLGLKARLELRPVPPNAPDNLGLTLTLSSPSIRVTQVGAPEMRLTGADRGVPIYARTSGGPERFDFALSTAQSDGDQTVRLLVERPWVDIPLRLSTGRRVTLAFEKGIIVRDTMRATFREWRLPWLP
jgi:hypothetical protein